MPSDDYTSVARGPLKLKGVVAGGKVKKHKKKSNKDKKTDLEKNLSTGDDNNTKDDDENKQLQVREGSTEEGNKAQTRTSQSQERDEEQKDDETKTEAERRFLEAKRKRVRTPLSFLPFFSFAFVDTDIL